MSYERASFRSPDGELLRAVRELSGERRDREKLVQELGEVYLNRARTDPEAIRALEVRLLRRSGWASLRAPAVLVWSRRRPAAFLRAAARFLDDQPEVRLAVAEGLANAAILEGLGAEDPQVAALLDRALADHDSRVRVIAEKARDLLGGEQGSI